jgi:hypothetical protein
MGYKMNGSKISANTENIRLLKSWLERINRDAIEIALKDNPVLGWVSNLNPSEKHVFLATRKHMLELLNIVDDLKRIHESNAIDTKKQNAQSDFMPLPQLMSAVKKLCEINGIKIDES